MRSTSEGADSRVPVAVLGASGIVGQHMIRLLTDHPIFRVAEVACSPARRGRRYGSHVDWIVGPAPPSEAAGLRAVDAEADGLDSPVVLSALPSVPAVRLERSLSGAGHVVCTNASAHRMDADVPLIVPEVNADALESPQGQRPSAGGGVLVANPNCVVTGLALALAPIERTWGVASATIVTLQALSGAGLAGVSGLALTGNVIPWIEGEEEKIGPELRKVLGSEVAVAVAVNRVPVVDGHTAHVFLRLERPARVGEVRDVLRSFSPPEGISALPSSLDFPVTVLERPDRPQPRLDARRSSGMAVTVGRVRTAPPYDLAMTLVVHNAIRGAAGACLANAELCVARGWVASSGRAIHRSTAPLAGGAS